MAKLREYSYYGYRPKPSPSPKRTDPFYIIYNHRRTLRAKALKKLKQEKRRREMNILVAQK